MTNKRISYLDLCKFLDKIKDRNGIIRFVKIKDCTIWGIPKNKQVFSYSAAGNFFFGYKMDRCKIKNNNYINI